MASGGRNGEVLVVGAGIAGMAAATHLAELGYGVHLLDTAPAIGGSMHLLDHTFPTNSCGICLMLPHQPALCPTLECDAHPNIQLHPLSELEGLDGEPGAFTARVRHKARYVDAQRCSGCGDCAMACPETRPHDYEGCLAPEKAIYRPAGLRAVPDTWVIDMEYCTRCGACVDACPENAIDLQMADHQEELAVGAVLLTPGFAPFDAHVKGEYGYGVYDNVLTALEFERMVSLAGSTGAHLTRPSSPGAAPQKMAFVHCVGSRDNLCGAGYCSSACCMYTAKQVALAKQIDPHLDVTVFFMDLRAFGKDFEAYVEGVQRLPGVTYRRAMPSSVHQLQQTRELLVTYVSDGGRLEEEAFDLLVLAVGLAPPVGMQHLARELGVGLNEYGFAVTHETLPTRTTRQGVFAAGAFREPKDIPETVAEAAAAAAEVAAFLLGTIEGERQQTIGELRDVSDEEPKVGVLVCECNGDLAPLGAAELVDWSTHLPGVAIAQAVADGCSPEGQALISDTIDREGLNRVVVAGCSHRLYTSLFEATMRQAGLDPRLLARVNLREQVALPHRHNGTGVTAKAQSLLAMAVASLRAMAGVDALTLGTGHALTRRALVVGGGAAGMTSALALARLGIPVDLVERETELGGQWRHIHYQLPMTYDPQAALTSLIAEVEAEDQVTIHTGAHLTACDGMPGQYRSTITQNGQERTIDHGVLLLATGGRPAATDEYLYGQDPRVLTQRELEQQIAEDTLATAQTVVMIQCVGSREPHRPYCSRVCCSQAVKNALKLKELRPELNVYVLYRELRTYGFREAHYEAARDAGVVFIRYELADAPVSPGTGKPRVGAEGDRLQVALTEPVTGQVLELDADLLVLSVGVEPAQEQELAERVGVALTGDGFFQEEHRKMKPLDLGRGGTYVAGLAHSPRFLEETIAQAQGAAMRAAAYLAPERVEPRASAVWVNERLCSFCGLCVEACPYEARVMNYDTRVADVDYALCQGCGVCAMVCPNKATLQKAMEHKQLMASIDMALG